MIYLISKTSQIIKHLTLELQKLKIQILELLDSRFIRPSVLFCDTRVIFVSKNEWILIDSQKIKSIVKWSTHINIIKIRIFLCLVGWYQRFIERFYPLALPLTNLTNKTTKLPWNLKWEECFRKLKQRLVYAPLLPLLNGTKYFVIYSVDSQKMIRLCAYATR